MTITVARSGGFAGLTREWSVSSAMDDADELLALVDACPWRSIPADRASRDRFVYLITVRAPRRRRTVRLPEASLTGPWKSLVQRVQQERQPKGPSNTTPAAL
ncbi:MAG: hypothetical protein H7226_07710 [Salinibacterium sp.]|nr:hypothetical protein [Salinibacterium sp.]